MKLSKIYLIIALVALVTAVPLASVLAQRDGQLKMERSTNQQLELKVDSIEKQLEQKNLETEKRNQELQKEQEKNKELEAKLQAKLKREEAEKIAAERARQASVAVSAPAPRASGSVDCGLARQLINQYDGWNKDVAYNVMVAESSCNTANENYGDYHSFADCRGSFGLFQINCSHGKVFDPAKNVAIAYSMYQASGWQPWSATTCKYKVACY